MNSTIVILICVCDGYAEYVHLLFASLVQDCMLLSMHLSKPLSLLVNCNYKMYRVEYCILLLILSNSLK